MLSIQSILISRFILNLRQVNHDLAHRSETCVSLDIQFGPQTPTSRSLPRSLEPFMQPLHVDIEDEGDMEYIPILDLDGNDSEESLGASETGLKAV